MMCSTECGRCDDKIGKSISDLNLGPSLDTQKANESPVSENPHLAVINTCRRCYHNQPYIMIEKTQVLCKDCFLESCLKKIRSTIGRSRLVRPNDNVLIAYSGGPSSSAMLDLIQTSIESNLGRMQVYRPSILYVDTQTSLNCSEKRISNLRNTLEELSSKYKSWPIFWTYLESCVNIGNEHYSVPVASKATFDSDNIYDIEAQQRFNSLTESMDITQKQNYIEKSIYKIIEDVSISINLSRDESEYIKYIFLGTSSTKLANDLMVSVILGDGAAASSVVSVCDNRYKIPFLRPMKDFKKKEISFYLLARNLGQNSGENSLTLSGPKSSIQRLTENFLAELYDDFPATYSTLLKTGSKLKL